jgi:mannose-P-dolichol utilization defect protein 1
MALSSLWRALGQNETDNNSMDYVSSMGTTTTSATFLAKGLGYVVGFGSLMLYTPIAIRLCRQKHANGLVMSTWWLKVFSYLLSDIYFVRNQYDLSTYVETVVITVESMVVLSLVAMYQHKTKENSFWICLGTLVAGAIYGFTIAPEHLVATGQLGGAFINAAALFPQFWHNFTTKTKGDYSPLTAGLALGGCAIRIFTTITLNGSDPVLLLSFFMAFLINGTLLLQILYYGVMVEGLTVSQVVLSDLVTAHDHDYLDGDGGAVVLPMTTTTNPHREEGGCYGGVFNEYGSGDGDPLSIMQRRDPHAPTSTL